MVKILFVAVGDKFGSGKALLNLIEELRKDNYTIGVVCSEELGLQDDLMNIGIKSFHIPMRFDIYPPLRTFKDYVCFIPRLIRDWVVNLKASISLGELIKEFNPDIVHTNVGVYRTPAKVCKKIGVPHIWHLREYQTLDMGYRPYGGIRGLTETVKKTGSVPICITKGLASYYGLSEKTVIYDGIKRPDNITLSKNIVKGNYYLFVGNITRHKGCTDLVDSYIKLLKGKKVNAPLLLAGGVSSEYAQDLIDHVHSEGFSDMIRFVGFTDKVYALMANAKALIVPSLFECFGLITAEAMYNKCLVIGRNTGGTKEQMDNLYENSGRELAIRFNDNEELMAAIISVESGERSKNGIVDEAFEIVDKLYSTKTNSNGIKRIYEQQIRLRNGCVNNHC